MTNYIITEQQKERVMFEGKEIESVLYLGKHRGFEQIVGEFDHSRGLIVTDIQIKKDEVFRCQMITIFFEDGSMEGHSIEKDDKVIVQFYRGDPFKKERGIKI